ncbi:MAG: transposase [Bacteroidota bacterium]
MSELRKANTDYPYFITLTVAGWIDIFTRPRYSEVIIKNLKHCVKEKNLIIYAYVIMPSHIHLVARHDESKLNEVLRDFKSFSAKQILKMIANEPGESRKEWLLHMFSYYAKHQKQNSKYMFWQKRNHPIELSYPEIIDQKIEYIHNNAVAAGYVIDPFAWFYSSANENSPLPVEQV